MTDYSPGEDFHTKHLSFGEAYRPDCTECDRMTVTVEVPPEVADAINAKRIGGYSIDGQDLEREYTIRELQERSHRQSRDKGFHDYQPTDLREIAALNAERVALFHSEASEMLEEQRKGHAPTHTYYSKTEKVHNRQGRLVRETIEYFEGQSYLGDRKPEGQPSEAADMMIRIMDWAGANGVDLQAAILEKLDYNATRAKMHGGKKF